MLITLSGCVNWGETPPSMQGAVCGERHHYVAHCVWQGRLYACTGNGKNAQCAQILSPALVEGK